MYMSTNAWESDRDESSPAKPVFRILLALFSDHDLLIRGKVSSHEKPPETGPFQSFHAKPKMN